MTRDELLELLRMVNVDELSDDYIFLHEKAIAWLEEEGNKELVDDRSNGSENKGVWWGWVLR